MICFFSKLVIFCLGLFYIPQLALSEVDLRSRLISGQQANTLLETNAKTTHLIDARPQKLFQRKLPKSINLRWEEFSEVRNEIPGLLKSKEKIRQQLAAKNIKNFDDAYVIIGSGANGWGEEGRILWMMAEVGFKNLFHVNGGVKAFLAKSPRLPKKLFFAEKASPLGRGFTPNQDNIRKNLSKLTLVDTRTLREYNGATPYGSPRGGHIDGSKNLPFATLFDNEGYILDGEQIAKIFAELKVEPAKPLLFYCTGGVRSAYISIIVEDLLLGSVVYNYDGSWWEWSRSSLK